MCKDGCKFDCQLTCSLSCVSSANQKSVHTKWYVK
jgi:hypothetical protein